MNENDYHSHDSISNSGLALLASKTPAHFFSSLTTPRADTPAFREGRNIHCAVLEPDRFASQFVVMPKWDMRTTVGKLASAEFHAANDGKTCIQQDELDRIIAIQNSVYAHPLARTLLIGGKAELSYFANDPVTGVKVRCRPDCSNGDILIDLKTTTDASTEGFARSAFAYRYYQQAAFYSDVFQWAGGGCVRDFYFIAVEKVAPFAVQVFKASPEFIARGREAYRAALNTYAECLASGIWPGYPESDNRLDIPAWAEKRLAMDDNPEITDISYE